MPEQNHKLASAEPKTSRPRIPKEYGVPKGKKGMLEWSQVEQWLKDAPIYWLATASPDGRPHARPIWGTWVDGAVYFGGSPETRWARNLAANSRIVVHIESGDAVVMLEGVAEVVNPDPTTSKQIADQSQAKYGYRPDSADGSYMVRPHKALAWQNSTFGTSATRWDFA
jgi:Pyridoxamine 5'-phosphate oxidase